MELTPSQSRADAAIARLHATKDVGGVCITGYAGTGKTTLIKMLAKKYGDPKVCTPTGKAALRVTEATGTPASTFHRWMYDPGTDEKTGGVKFVLKHPSRLQLPGCKLVLVDEASMISSGAWADMWSTCRRLGLKIVLIGDGFQLPPVEAGNPSNPATPFSTMTPEFAAKHEFERVEMTDIVRQAADSPVVKAATGLRNGDRRAIGLLPRVEDLFKVGYECLANGGVIISHTNFTRHKINKAFRQPALHPQEPLLILRNDYELDVYNGQQLRFEGWDQAPTGEVQVVHDKYRGTSTPALFGVGRVDGLRVLLCPSQIDGSLDASEYSVGEAGRLWARGHNLRSEHRPEALMPVLHANYGYCFTAHKAQGSEWPWALVVLERSVNLGTEDGLRWAYTAITRAKTMAAVFQGNP
jgi:ATP-dependent exoDNAse (exonuclease V) alpha subunit